MDHHQSNHLQDETNNTLSKNTYETEIMTKWTNVELRGVHNIYNKPLPWKQLLLFLGVDIAYPTKGWRITSQQKLGSICKKCKEDTIEITANWRYMLHVIY